MYRCNDCGGEFDNPEIESFNVPYGNGFTVCPGNAVSPCCGCGFEEVRDVDEEEDEE